MEPSKIINPHTDKQAKLEEKIDVISSHLNEVQESMELILSLLLGDDAKRGRGYLNLNANSFNLIRKDDTFGDGGNK